MLEAVTAETVKAEADMKNSLSGISANQQEISSLRAPIGGEGKVCTSLRWRSMDVVVAFSRLE
jgi:hypothetical protein